MTNRITLGLRRRLAVGTMLLSACLSAGDESEPLEVLWVQYGLANDTLKLAAHTNADPHHPTTATARLQVGEGAGWETISEVSVDPLTTVAEFRIDNWDSSQNARYRVLCGEGEIEGTVRADPVDQKIITLMAVSCVNDKRFPYEKAVAQMVSQDPDLVFFAGDQLYQTNSGGLTLHANTEAEVVPAMALYLAKWRKFGLTFRDLLKDRPSIILTDDHDVYATDLWGNGGKRMDVEGQPNEPYIFSNATDRKRMTMNRTKGGYLHPKWVNAVERAQMWHLPDGAQPGPWGDGIFAYFTSLEFGGVSFAIIEDRKFKSPPSDAHSVPLQDPELDKPNTDLETIMDPYFDTETLDIPGLNLLGEAQEEFLREWSAEVAQSGRLAAVLHQSPFANVGNYRAKYGDMDSNGWPQTARDTAIRAMIPAQPVLVSGDLHYATIFQHGVDEWGEGPWAYSLPAFSAGQGRTWGPSVEPQGGAIPGMAGSGNHYDRMGNKVTMVAKADGVSGYGSILFNKASREITFQIYPMDPDTLEPIELEVPGWPKRITVE
ncbi:alkaline phosphatase D family protein [Opitutaceae bacterium]|nr:alkaline phosphatase D family protein [Opitutaceae bacterium]